MKNVTSDKRNLWMFPLGTVGRDMIYNLFTNFIFTYILFTRNLTAAQLGAVTAIMVGARVFDALNDPVMGNIIERTRSRYGKFKPWLVIGILSTSVVVYLAFNTSLQGWSFIVFFGVIYFLYSITYTMHDISYWGMVSALSSDPHVRNSLTSRTNLFAGIGGVIASILIPMLTTGSGTLGGSAILASKAPCKHMAQEFVDTQIAEMQEYGIEVHLNTPGTVARIQTLEPYCVVVACGGNQIIPKVPGADRDNVYYIEDVLLGKVQFAGKKIAVIGGGHVGLEVAHYLCADNQVTVVEMQKEVGTSIYRTAKYKLLSLLQENGVEILTQHALAGVGEGTVELKQLPGGETVSVDADIVIMALGNRPDKSYEQQLKDAFDKVVFVGDANKGGTMADATLSAYENCWFF